MLGKNRDGWKVLGSQIANSIAVSPVLVVFDILAVVAVAVAGAVGFGEARSRLPMDCCLEELHHHHGDVDSIHLGST